jgi:hypothetical protein
MKTRLMVMAIGFPARAASPLTVLKMGTMMQVNRTMSMLSEPQHHGGERQTVAHEARSIATPCPQGRMPPVAVTSDTSARQPLPSQRPCRGYAEAVK